MNPRFVTVTRADNSTAFTGRARAGEPSGDGSDIAVQRPGPTG